MKLDARGVENKPKSAGNEKGFTLIELAITVLILGIIISISAVSYMNISTSMNINGAKKQVETALDRAKTAARQENVSYELKFFPSSEGVKANSYEFYHNVYDEVSGLWNMAPVDGSVSGEKVRTDIESGHWIIALGTGADINNGVTVTFSPSGTVMAVTPSTISLEAGSETGSVSINSDGQIAVD